MTARVSPAFKWPWAVEGLHAQHGHVKIIDVGGPQRYSLLFAAGYRESRVANYCGQSMRPPETIQH